MSNHIHLIVNVDMEFSLSDIIRDFNHAIELYSERFTWIKVRYIHQNPVRAGLVTSPEFWKYSSASNYQEMKSVLPEVYRLTPPLTLVK